MLGLRSSLILKFFLASYPSPMARNDSGLDSEMKHVSQSANPSALLFADE